MASTPSHTSRLGHVVVDAALFIAVAVVPVVVMLVIAGSSPA
jgi:hypothetical protein